MTDAPESTSGDVVMAGDGVNRREMLALLAGMAPLLLTGGAGASPIDTSETLYALPKDINFVPQAGAPPKSIESAYLYSKSTAEGIYYTLIRWYPGYMSAPHSYASDRLCVVLSGTWWINSGEDFDPGHTVPVPAGTFVRRIARTWHYDGVRRGEPEPVVIAICGIGPVDIRLAEPDKPLVRAV
jgi:hypothetical protein